MVVSWTPRSDFGFPVTITCKNRIVTIKGPRGQITKDLSHLQVEMRLMDNEIKGKKVKAVRIRMWFGSYKQKCQVKTVHTLLNNAISGVREVSTSPVCPTCSIGGFNVCRCFNGASNLLIINRS